MLLLLQAEGTQDSLLVQGNHKTVGTPVAKDDQLLKA